jgi:hypothetical protein
MRIYKIINNIIFEYDNNWLMLIEVSRWFNGYSEWHWLYE